MINPPLALFLVASKSPTLTSHSQSSGAPTYMTFPALTLRRRTVVFLSPPAPW